MNNSNSLVFYKNTPRNTVITMLTVIILVSMLIVAFNLATILTFLINRHLRRRSIYCLIHLAVVDMMYGVLTIVSDLCFYDFYFGTKLFTSVVVKNVVVNIVDINIVTCLLSLVLVSLERVYATFFPFHHRTTHARTYFMVFAIVWLFPVCVLGPYIQEEVTSSFGVMLVTGLIVLSLVCLVTICISYTAMFMKLKKQARLLQANQLPRELRRTRKREQHLGMTLFIVTVLSLAAWLPWITLVFFKAWQTLKISFFGYRMIRLIHLMNSLINPIVYVSRMRDFRKAMVKMLCRCSRDLQRPHLVVQYDKNGGKNQPVIELGLG